MLNELRKAIKSHKTDVVDKAWDAGVNEKNLKKDMDASYYNKAYAWRDSEADEKNKSSYKFIHHMVSADGIIGAANVKACQSAIGVLNGARGGTKIPKADYRGVWNHVAKHLRDADITPPELKSTDDNIEFRNTMAEFRVSDDGKHIEGYAAVFNSLSLNMGFYYEQILPGAFKKTIQEADIRALFNHDPNYVLGRNTNGTLELNEDNHGLKVKITPPKTQWADDLKESIKRKDISQMSFGFRVIKDDVHENNNNDLIRDLIEVKLFDVSPVTFPAYPQTEVSLRNLFSAPSFRDEKIIKTFINLTRAEKINPEDLQTVQKYVTLLKEKSEPVENHSEPKEEPEKFHSENGKRNTEVLRRQLDYFESLIK